MKGSASKGAPEAGFYEQALSEAERLRIPRARQMEGLEEEIALLRVRLLRLAQEHPEQFELLLKGVALLVRAVATKYRLSPQSQEDLSRSLAGVITSIGTQLGLGEMKSGE